MKKIKGKITISRTTSNKRDDYVSISINCKNSSLRVLTVEIDMVSFGNLITGLAYQNCDIEICNNYDLLGKKKITKTVQCKKVYDKKRQKEIVNADYSEKYIQEWDIWDDGTHSQQNSELHNYILCKYVDKEE